MRLSSKLKLLTSGERGRVAAIFQDVKSANANRLAARQPHLLRNPERPVKRWLRETAKVRGADRARRARKARQSARRKSVQAPA